MAKVANFVILFMALTLAFEAQAARFGRPNPADADSQLDSGDSEGPPAPFNGRIPRPAFDETGEGDLGIPEDEAMNDAPAFERPSFGGSALGGSAGGSFGTAPGKIEFKIVSPDQKPANPRAAFYERYKKYRR